MFAVIPCETRPLWLKLLTILAVLYAVLGIPMLQEPRYVLPTCNDPHAAGRAACIKMIWEDIVHGSPFFP